MDHRSHLLGRALFRLGIVTATALATFDTSALAQPSLFEAPADLFYLHPLVNYQLPLSWQARWERERLSSNGVQATVGSISTKDFTTLVRVDVNEPATDALRLLYRLEWTDTPHLDGGEQQTWIGLELGGLRTRWGRWAVEVVAHPPADKSEVDLVASLVWTDASRTRYLRLGRRSDDFLFEEKSDTGALVDQTARGPEWAAHTSRGRWSLSSEGTVLRRQVRRFPDVELSTDLAFASLQRSWSSSAVRYDDGRGQVELRLEHRDFDATERDRAGGESARASEWRHVSLAYELALADRWRVRLQIHRLHVDQRIDRADHERRETLGGAFVERALGRGHTVELGVMATDFAWTTGTADSPFGPDRDGMANKLGLGWSYTLGTRGALRVTLSHEPDPQEFGGANMQLQLLF